MLLASYGRIFAKTILRLPTVLSVVIVLVI